MKRFFAAMFCVALCLPLVGMSTGLAQAQTPDMVENLSKIQADSESVLWLSVAYSENLADIGYYLEQYPDGKYVGIANRKFDHYAELARKKNAVIQAENQVKKKTLWIMAITLLFIGFYGWRIVRRLGASRVT